MLKLMQAVLTVDGTLEKLVARVELPPFHKPPDVLMWGARIFGVTGELDEGDPIYREAFFYVVADGYPLRNPEHSPRLLAERMFNAYNAAGPNPGKTWDGKDVPPFSAVGPQVTAKWEAAAREALGLDRAVEKRVEVLDKQNAAGWPGSEPEPLVQLAKPGGLTYRKLDAQTAPAKDALQRPSVGRIVHFHEEGGPYAAIVAAVNVDGTAELATVGPRSLYFQHRVPEFSGAGKPPAGFWTWPPRV